MLKRALLAVVVGSLLAAAGVAYAAPASFGAPGVAARGPAVVGTCADLRVEYTQAVGLVTLVSVIDGLGDCAGKRVHIIVQDQDFLVMYSGSANVVAGVADFAQAPAIESRNIRRTIVTVADA